MNQFTAIIAGKRCTMLTGESLEEAARSCRDRFGERFEGFEPVPIEAQARIKWGDYRAKRITREALEAWLKEQSQEDEKQIRSMYNSLRAGDGEGATEQSGKNGTTAGSDGGGPFPGCSAVQRSGRRMGGG